VDLAHVTSIRSRNRAPRSRSLRARARVGSLAVWPSAQYHRISACHRDLNFKSANAVFLPRSYRLSPCYRAGLPPALNFKFPARPPCRIAAATSDFRVLPAAYALSFVHLPGPTLFQGTRSVAAFIYGGRVPGIDSVIYLAAPIRAIPPRRHRPSPRLRFDLLRVRADDYLIIPRVYSRFAGRGAPRESNPTDRLRRRCLLKVLARGTLRLIARHGVRRSRKFPARARKSSDGG